MASLKELYDLVHVLSKDEKKHISLLINSIGGKAKYRYSNALNIINKEKIYNEKILRHKLDIGFKGMNLSEANNNIYEFICKSLLSYKQINYLGYTNKLYLLEFFINRKLYAHSHKLLQKLIPEIEEKGTLASLQRAYELQEIITINYKPVNNDYKYRVEFFKKYQNVIDQAKININLLHLNFKFFHLLKTIGSPRTLIQKKEYEILWKDPLLHIPTNQIPIRSVKIVHTLKGALMFILDYDESENYIRNEIVNYRERFKGKNLAQGESNLIDLLLSIIATRDKINWEELQSIKKRINELKKEIVVLSAHQQMQTKSIILDLIYFIKEKRYKDGIKHFEYHMQPKEIILWQQSPLSYMILFLGARLYYLNNELDKTLFYIIKMQDYEKNMRPYFYMGYKFLTLLCHYKLGNYQLLDSLIISLTRALRKLNALYAPERAILKFLKHVNDVNKFEFYLKKLSLSLNELYKNSLHRDFFEFSDFKEWLDL